MDEFAKNLVSTVAGICQRLVHSLSVLIELAANIAKQLHVGRRPSLLNDAPLPQSAFQFIHHPFFVGVVAVNLEASVAQAHHIHSAFNHFQCRHLFRHEQHPFSLSQSLRHKVGDSLRFARARWPLDHHVAAIFHIEDGRQLRAVGINHLMRFFRRQVIVEQCFIFVRRPSFIEPISQY